TKVDGIEAIQPEVIKYLVEIGEIMSGQANDARYLAGSQCIISPLILEKRSADEMVERARLQLHDFHVASMPTVGVNFPVTPAAAVIMSAAETLGGMVAAYCLAPSGDITGRMIATYMDMKTADTTSANPESILLDLAVKELFDECFGGHLWTEVFFSPAATEPGMLAVHQNYYAAMARAHITGDVTCPYPGMGTLDNGAVGSPTQFMLDMDIRKSQWHFARQTLETNEETVPFEQMLERARNKEHFLNSDHTMQHFRELWNSDILPLSVGSSSGVNHEAAILDECEDRWRANLEAWEPPEIDDDTMQALQGVLNRAEQEFL
ncbi:MAG: trimethylamine methyltransferase family protein, partial [Armatimonadota bacterium]